MTEHVETACPRCGEAAADYRFCPFCGLNLGSMSEVPGHEWETGYGSQQPADKPLSLRPSQRPPIRMLLASTPPTRRQLLPSLRSGSIDSKTPPSKRPGRLTRLSRNRQEPSGRPATRASSPHTSRYGPRRRHACPALIRMAVASTPPTRRQLLPSLRSGSIDSKTPPSKRPGRLTRLSRNRQEPSGRPATRASSPHTSRYGPRRRCACPALIRMAVASTPSMTRGPRP